MAVRVGDMLVQLPEIVLTSEDEVALARRIEAGWYAEHLLSKALSLRSQVELQLVAADGVAAWKTAFTACLRVVRVLAFRCAGRTGYDTEDAFQAGCMTLARALQAWDYRGEARLVTYVWRSVERGLRDYCCTRGGRLEAPAAVIRAALAAPDSSVWHPPRLVGDISLFERGGEPEVVSAGELLAEVWPLLSPHSADLLAARHGIGCPRVTAEKLAKRLQMSTRALRRMERRAEEELRQLLRAAQNDQLCAA